MNKPNDHETPFRIPQLIHFVWAGGDKLMGEKEIEVVAKWCTGNPSCTVNLWVDHQSYSAGANDLVQEYSSSFDDYNVDVVTDPALRPKNKPCILIRDISEYEKVFRDEIYLSEINQLQPNYGCSSDILRLRVLYAEGGCYFDQDVPPNSNLSLDDSGIFNPRTRHCIILEHHPQHETPTPLVPHYIDKPIVHGSSPEESSQESSRDSGEQREPSESTDDSYSRFIKLKFDVLGNDAIITTKHNPFIKAALDKALANYHLHPSQRTKIIAECYAGKDRKNSSVGRTGPPIIKETIEEMPHLSLENGVLQLHCDIFGDEAIEFEAMRTKDRELTQPKGNSQNWLKVLHRKIDDSTLCRSVILDRIKFEAAHFHILRLDDHLDDMAITMRKPKDSGEFSSNMQLLLESIDPVILKNVVITQVTFANPETIQFCNHHQLTTILNLKPNEFIQAITYTIYFNDTYFILDTLLSRQKALEITMDEYAKWFTEDELSTILGPYKITLDALSLLTSAQNIQQFSSPNQLAFCELIINNRNLLENGAKLLLRKDESLAEQIRKIITFAENHHKSISSSLIQFRTKQNDAEDTNGTPKHRK